MNLVWHLIKFRKLHRMENVYMACKNPKHLFVNTQLWNILQFIILVSPCPSACPSVHQFSRNTTPVASFQYSWSLYGYFRLCGLPQKWFQMISCHVSLLFRRKKTHIMDTWVCPCLQWTKKHTLCPFVSQCPCMDCSFLQNATSVASFWYSRLFFGYFVYVQPHKTDTHIEKTNPNLWIEGATGHHFVDPSAHPSVCPSVDRIVSVLYFYNTCWIHFIYTQLIK